MIRSLVVAESQVNLRRKDGALYPSDARALIRASPRKRGVLSLGSRYAYNSQKDYRTENHTFGAKNLCPQ